MRKLEDLAEKFKIALLKNYSGTDEDYTNRLVSVLRKAYILGIDANNLFFARQVHKRNLKRKADRDERHKATYESLDDLSARNGKFWKELSAKYRYHYKDIE